LIDEHSGMPPAKPIPFRRRRTVPVIKPSKRVIPAAAVRVVGEVVVALPGKAA